MNLNSLLYENWWIFLCNLNYSNGQKIYYIIDYWMKMKKKKNQYLILLENNYRYFIDSIKNCKLHIFWCMCCPINFSETLSIIFSLITTSLRIYLASLKNDDEKNVWINRIFFCSVHMERKESDCLVFSIQPCKSCSSKWGRKVSEWKKKKWYFNFHPFSNFVLNHIAPFLYLSDQLLDIQFQQCSNPECEH